MADGPVSEDVWPFEESLGYRSAIESAGSVAAPLLAGFSFTLLVLLLPTLGTEQEVVATAHGIRVATDSEGISVAPELAVGLLLAAGLLFVFTIQAGVFLRLHNHKPADLFEWFPEYFPQGADEDPGPAAGLEEWTTTKWPAMRIGGQWYGGWPRRYLFEETRRAERWAVCMRLLYQAGILALLIGLTVVVWPPAEQATLARWLITAVGGAGALAEAGWMAIAGIQALRSRSS